MSASLAAIHADFSGRVITAEDPDYDAARAVFFPMADRRPAMIVRPTGPADVAHGIALARESGLELAVRGGGHSHAGHGTTEGGIVLDLSLMKTLHIDVADARCWAGAGLTAGELSRATEAHGLGLSLGDTATVGIGGLTLGGGIGYFVRKHGLTIDDVIAAEVVTADGDLRLTDQAHEPDLFWALRGGGGNFGVVTRFAYRLHPVDALTGGVLVLPATAESIAHVAAAAEAAPDELSMAATVVIEPAGAPVVRVTLVHSGPRAAAAGAITPLRELTQPLADTIGPMSYTEILPPGDGSSHPHVAAQTLFVDRIDQPVAEHLLECLTEAGGMAVAQIRFLGGAMARVPEDATAFAHRKGRIMLTVAAIYPAAEQASARRAWARQAAASLRQSDAGSYVNFLPDVTEAGTRAAYPGRTLQRLQAIKARYDPANVFRLNHNIAPLAPPSSSDTSR